MSEPHSEQLRLLIERIERLNEDKKGIQDDSAMFTMKLRRMVMTPRLFER